MKAEIVNKTTADKNVYITERSSYVKLISFNVALFAVGVIHLTNCEQEMVGVFGSVSLTLSKL